MFKKLKEKIKLKKMMIEQEKVEKEMAEKERIKEREEKHAKFYEEYLKKNLFYKNCPICGSKNFIHSFQKIREYGDSGAYFKCKDCNYDVQNGYKNIEEARELSFARTKIENDLIKIIDKFYFLDYEDFREIIIYKLKEKCGVLHNELID